MDCIGAVWRTTQIPSLDLVQLHVTVSWIVLSRSNLSRCWADTMVIFSFCRFVTSWWCSWWRWWCRNGVRSPRRSSIQWMRQRCSTSVIALGLTYGRTAATRQMHALTPRIGQGSFAMPTKLPLSTCTTHRLDPASSYIRPEPPQHSLPVDCAQISIQSKKCRRITSGVDREYVSAAAAVRLIVQIVESLLASFNLVRIIYLLSGTSTRISSLALSPLSSATSLSWKFCTLKLASFSRTVLLLYLISDSSF